VKDALGDFGVKLFLAMFDMWPTLLDLFPFKDPEGKPIIKELAVHGLKVASTLGEVVERLQNYDTLSRWVCGKRGGKRGVDRVEGGRAPVRLSYRSLWMIAAL
jgi:hypothetical protein